jgi:catechol 2,3-dioxygenase-like lactoylglutathione lyase family enzyme
VPPVPLLGDHGAMDVLSSRVLLHPTDPERSRVFYRDALGLAIYREFGGGPDRGTVFFLGGGFLELSGRAAAPPAPGMALWLQVRELAAVRRELGERGVPILREPKWEPWGAGDVDRRPGWGAYLHRGGAGGASAAPPQLTCTSVFRRFRVERRAGRQVVIRYADGVVIARQ